MFDESTMLANARAAWMRHHRMTYSFLDSLTERELYFPLSRPGLNTLAKHYEEMADVQQAYARAFHSGKLDFSMLSKEKPYEGKSTREELRAAMERADQAIQEGIEACPPDRAFDIFGLQGSRADLIQTLLHHELFHHGQFSVFIHELKIDLPPDWREFWWLPVLYGPKSES
jgi:uncharacterized damage-inducible protein DinB